jgi:hypothetical protein
VFLFEVVGHVGLGRREKPQHSFFFHALRQHRPAAQGSVDRDGRDHRHRDVFNEFTQVGRRFRIALCSGRLHAAT